VLPEYLGRLLSSADAAQGALGRHGCLDRAYRRLQPLYSRNRRHLGKDIGLF
jgi:hypothetical protein